MRRTALLLIIFCTAAFPLIRVRAQPRHKPLVFTHVAVIDATGAPAKPDMTVIVSGDRIRQIGKSGKVPIPENAQVIDASGKFLIPGLWDMHVHTLRRERINTFFPLFIANGVTGVRDMGTPLGEFDRLEDLRKEISDGALIGPRIVSGGPPLDGPKQRRPDLSLIVTSPADAREKVRMLKGRGVDFIKVVNLLTREEYLAVIDEARRQGFSVAGHIPWSISAAEASDSGQKSIEHLGSAYVGVLLSCSAREAEIRKVIFEAIREPSSTQVSVLPVQRAQSPRMLDTYDAKKAAALFRRFSRNKTWQVPTLALLRAFAYGNDPGFINDPRLKYISPSMTAGWEPQNNPFFQGITAEDVANGKRLYLKQIEVVGTMHRAGVRIMAGSDAPNPYIFPGFSLHDELGLFVKAGLTPLEALQTATTNPAKFLGREKELGTVERGKLADLVLLDADPLTDISNTKKINAVVVNGRLLERTTLDKMLADAEAAANKK